MKKSTKALVALIFCLTLIMATFVPAFAASVGQVKGAKATDVTYNSAVLTWTKVSKVSGYEVEKYNDSTKKWSKYGDDIKSSANTKSLTKLTTGTTYKFRVRAFSKSLVGKKTYGAYSATVSVKPMPAKVTGLKASAITATTATLSWTKVAGATGYKVQLYKDKKWTDYKKLSANTLALTKLTVNTTYKYRVAAYKTVSKKDFIGAYSSELSVKTAVGEVTSLKVSGVKPTSASASWKALTDVSGYTVLLTDPDGKKIVSKNVKDAKYSFTNLIPKTKYTLKVTAYKTISGKNYNGKAATVTFTPTVAAPTELKVTKTAKNSVALSWTAAANVTGYDVQYFVDGAWKSFVKTQDTTATVTGLTDSTEYKFKVRSYVTASSKNYYSSYTAELVKATLCAAPSNFEAIETGKTSVTLTWTKIPAATGYKVYQLKAGKYTEVADTKSTTCKVDKLEASTVYSFKVAAYIASGSSKSVGEKSSAVTVFTSPLTVQKKSIADQYVIRWATLGSSTEVKYKPEKYNYETKKWESTVSETSAIYPYSYLARIDHASKADSFDITVKYDGSFYTTVSWKTVNNADVYSVQYTTDDGESWVDVKTVQGVTSTKIVLPPNVTAKVRVTAVDAKYRVSYYNINDTKKVDGYSFVKTLGSMSKLTEVTTKAAGALNTSDNKSKTLYTLMLAQAINNTKSETGRIDIVSKSKTDANIDKITLGYKNLLGKYTTKEFKNIDTLIAFINTISDEPIDASDFADLADNISFTGTSIGGYVEYTDEEGKQHGGYLSDLIIPTDSAAYLYNADDVNSFAKKVSSVKAVNNADGSITLTIKLVKETTDNKNPETPVHNGLAQGMGGLSDDMSGASASVGETTIVAKINKDYTLDTYSIKSPFSVSAVVDGSETDSKYDIGMYLSGSMNSDYTFKR